MVNKANKTAVELASENGKAEVAKLIAEYKTDANIRRNIQSTTLDTPQDEADENRMNKEMVSLHAAAEEGNIDIVKSLLERGETLYQILVQRGHREMADYVRRYGAGRERFDEILLWLTCDV